LASGPLSSREPALKRRAAQIAALRVCYQFVNFADFVTEAIVAT
jgi:hypothetical protein